MLSSKSFLQMNTQIKIHVYRNTRRSSKAFGQYWYVIKATKNGKILVQSEMIKNRKDLLKAATNFHCEIHEHTETYYLPKKES